MDYTLPAPKFFVSQLADTDIHQTADGDDESAKWTRYRVRGVTFQRVWLQGVLTASDVDIADGIGALDDGSGVIELDMSKVDRRSLRTAPTEFSREEIVSVDKTPLNWVVRAYYWQKGFEGAYILVIGPLTIDRDDGGRYVKVHKVVDLSNAPNREAIWTLEVLEADKMRSEPAG